MPSMKWIRANINSYVAVQFGHARDELDKARAMRTADIASEIYTWLEITERAEKMARKNGLRQKGDKNHGAKH